MAELASQFVEFIGRFDGGFKTVADAFSKDYIRTALVVTALIALCSSLLGVALVLKRFSFIGDGLSHVAFGAMAVAAVVGLTNEMLLALPVTVFAAVLLLRTGRKAKIAGDASLAMLSVGALGIGYLLRNLFSVSGNVSGDVCSTLFGGRAILTLTAKPYKVWLCVIMSVIVIALFIIFYNKIFSVTFDEVFASATGVNASAYNLLIAIITAVIIVLAMNLVGSLLISALVVFPAISAMRVFKSYKSVVICSACISVFCAAGGLLLSVPGQTPIGSTIVAVDIFAFIVFSLIGKIKKRV